MPEPIAPPVCLMLIFVDETDTWGPQRVPLHEAIVEMLAAEGLSGATVMPGVMGFGPSGQVHRRRLFGMTDERPMTILVVENDGRLRAVAPRLRTMVREGLVLLVPVELLHQGIATDSSGDSAAS